MGKLPSATQGKVFFPLPCKGLPLSSSIGYLGSSNPSLQHEDLQYSLKDEDTGVHCFFLLNASLFERFAFSVTITGMTPGERRQYLFFCTKAAFIFSLGNSKCIK